jgi:hypothetical protein
MRAAPCSPGVERGPATLALPLDRAAGATAMDQHGDQGHAAVDGRKRSDLRHRLVSRSGLCSSNGCQCDLK